MSLIEQIQAKEMDIYISLFFTLLGLILGVIVDCIRDSNVSATQRVFINVTLTNVVNPINQCKVKQLNERDLFPVIICITTTLLIAYLFFRSEILNTLSLVTVFIISLWAGSTLHSIYKGYFIGIGWFIALAFSLAFCTTALFLVNKAITPDYAPKYFQYSQEIINESGVLGLTNYFTLQDLPWFTFHIIGIVMLVLAKIRMTLSSTYFVLAGHTIYYQQQNNSWLVKRTRKYADLRNTIIYVSILSVAAYYFISGNFYMWFTYSLPSQFQNFLNTVLHGHQI